MGKFRACSETLSLVPNKVVLLPFLPKYATQSYLNSVLSVPTCYQPDMVNIVTVKVVQIIKNMIRNINENIQMI